MIKAGFAGDDQPKSFFSSYVGRPKHVRAMTGAIEGDYFIGSKAEEVRGLLRINYPLEHGIVTNWDDMEKIWHYLYTEELKILPEEHPVLLTEAPLNPKSNRETAAQIFFETFNVPAMFTGIQAVLALYASGRTTGLVLDSGDGVTHCVPVYEGFAVQNAVSRMDVAGRDVTNRLQLLLRINGYHFHTSAEREIVRTIKEKACYVSLNAHREEKDIGARNDSIMLPDGNVLKLGAEAFMAPEALFNPELIGVEHPGIPQMIHNSIQKSDLDMRRTFYSSIVLSGGSTLYRGFGERVLQDLTRLAPKDMKIKLNAVRERKYITWQGGSILASLSTFKKIVYCDD
ncbi:actin-related protein [Ramicandelaber brevisporus]|nr:actin-related protein [Ramicandelaber brevisporus]